MPDSPRYAMIMAGGAGTRLWPLSRKDRPKQLLPFINGQSLLEIAAGRLEGIVPPQRRLICTGEAHRAAIRASLPALSDEQILGEPVGRDTVNAIGFTAAVLSKRDPDAVFAVLTADHLIEPRDEFARRLDVGFRLVEDDSSRFVTFAIKPTFAATGYGYVESGPPIAGYDEAFQALQFVEKPDEETAKAYFRTRTFGWNSGMFIFHAGRFLEALSWFKSDSYEGLMKIAEAWDTPQRAAVLEEVYPTLPKISVDYAIMEPASKDDRLTVCSVPMEVSWMDVGSWPSYGETLMPDGAGCRGNARHLHLDSRNVLAVSDDPEHLISTIGCEDLIVIRTRDVTMVCPANQAQRVKDLAGMVDEELQ
ncbi:MAG: mannose-1-phosphate guanylyltransferase [Planctomycetota bacterium]|nr:mannose-1-phosphate guanylyltransferase [Planctomycetota bacterium]